VMGHALGLHLHHKPVAANDPRINSQESSASSLFMAVQQPSMGEWRRTGENWRSRVMLRRGRSVADAAAGL
jgi:hypothetical protein